MFATIIFPILLIIFGMLSVYHFRRDNFGCGDDVSDQSETVQVKALRILSSILIVTYALEVFIFPAIIVNEIIRCLRSTDLFDRDRGRAFRFEFKFGLFLKLLQYLTRGKAGGMDLKNKGELSDFATHGKFNYVYQKPILSLRLLYQICVFLSGEDELVSFIITLLYSNGSFFLRCTE